MHQRHAEQLMRDQNNANLDDLVGQVAALKEVTISVQNASRRLDNDLHALVRAAALCRFLLD